MYGSNLDNTAQYMIDEKKINMVTNSNQPATEAFMSCCNKENKTNKDKSRSKSLVHYHIIINNTI